MQLPFQFALCYSNVCLTPRYHEKKKMTINQCNMKANSGCCVLNLMHFLNCLRHIRSNSDLILASYINSGWAACNIISLTRILYCAIKLSIFLYDPGFRSNEK